MDEAPAGYVLIINPVLRVKHQVGRLSRSNGKNWFWNIASCNRPHHLLFPTSLHCNFEAGTGWRVVGTREDVLTGHDLCALDAVGRLGVPSTVVTRCSHLVLNSRNLGGGWTGKVVLDCPLRSWEWGSKVSIVNGPSPVAFVEFYMVLLFRQSHSVLLRLVVKSM